MSLLEKLNDGAAQVLGEVQDSVARARLEAERRVLARRHRGAVHDLGQRSYELIKSGELPGDTLAGEVAEVDTRLDDIEAVQSRIDALRDDDDDEAASAGPGWEAADRYFS